MKVSDENVLAFKHSKENTKWWGESKGEEEVVQEAQDGFNTTLEAAEADAEGLEVFL